MSWPWKIGLWRCISTLYLWRCILCVFFLQRCRSPSLGNQGLSSLHEGPFKITQKFPLNNYIIMHVLLQGLLWSYRPKSTTFYNIILFLKHKASLLKIFKFTIAKFKYCLVCISAWILGYLEVNIRSIGIG